MTKGEEIHGRKNFKKYDIFGWIELLTLITFCEQFQINADKITSYASPFLLVKCPVKDQHKQTP